MRDEARLAGDWSLWRDFAVRTAGFPVSGLDAFGPGDEAERLRAVASDPLFREAVTWQNPAAADNALAKVAAAAPTKPSRARQREEIVASYWQRYCAKSDTIGFFGPLAWGRIEDDGAPLRARSGALVRERAVHLESWGVQALAETIDPELRIATAPRSEDELRAALESRDGDVRERGLAALDRLEAAREAVAAAPPDRLRDALAALDGTFLELTGREPVRNQGRAYGARTLAYIDCMRDLDVSVGPALVADLAPALCALFEATRWYSGRVNAIGRRIIERALPAGGRGPLMPLLGESLRSLMQFPPEIADAVAELQRRFTALLSDPDRSTLAARAAGAFADHEPGWPLSVFDSVDVQIAATTEADVADGRYLAVVGDVHPGNNPLVQGVFAHRHPDPRALMDAISDATGPGLPLLLPPWGPGLAVDARGFPLTPEDAINVAAVPDTRAQRPRVTWQAQELAVDGDYAVDRSGRLRVPLLDLFAMPIFIAGVRSFELLPDEEHATRVAVGRTVLQRESWNVRAADVPERAEDVAAFARDRGMPRRVFAKSPLERKPMYLDVESPVLGRILCRHARRAAAEEAGARVRFTEMLPGPDECWLADDAGNRYVSELRLVAVDETMRSRSAGQAPAANSE